MLPWQPGWVLQLFGQLYPVWGVPGKAEKQVPLYGPNRVHSLSPDPQRSQAGPKQGFEGPCLLKELWPPLPPVPLIPLPSFRNGH